MTSGILDDIRVLDFTDGIVGPLCSRILADMGAEVIKVEWPRRVADLADEGGPARHGPEAFKSGANVLVFHANGGKKSLCVNLKEARGLELVKSLVARTDVLVENFTPHVMRKYGLHYDGLRAIKPSIIMCSLSGYGQDGLPGYPDHPCTDPVAQAMGGLNWITGVRDGPPFTIGGGIGDSITAMGGPSPSVTHFFTGSAPASGSTSTCPWRRPMSLLTPSICRTPRPMAAIIAIFATASRTRSRSPWGC